MGEIRPSIIYRAKKILKRGGAVVGGLATMAVLHGEFRPKSESTEPVSLGPDIEHVEKDIKHVEKPTAREGTKHIDADKKVQLQGEEENPATSEISEQLAYTILDTADPFSPDYPFDKETEQYWSDQRARAMGFVIDDGLVYKHWGSEWVACKGGAICERTTNPQDFQTATATEDQHIALLQTFIDKLPGASIERVNPWRYTCTLGGFVSYIEAESDGSFTIRPEFKAVDQMNVNSITEVPEAISKLQEINDLEQKQALAQN